MHHPTCVLCHAATTFVVKSSSAAFRGEVAWTFLASWKMCFALCPQELKACFAPWKCVTLPPEMSRMDIFLRSWDLRSIVHKHWFLIKMMQKYENRSAGLEIQLINQSINQPTLCTYLPCIPTYLIYLPTLYTYLPFVGQPTYLIYLPALYTDLPYTLTYLIYLPTLYTYLPYTLTYPRSGVLRI